MSFENKIVLVTGASRGIGASIALTLGKAGALIIGTATTEEGAQAITKNLQDAQIKGQGILLNIADRASIDLQIKTITEQFGAPSILINNAGITRDNIFLRMKDEQWDDVINTNLSGVFFVTKACLKNMVRQRWGRIINISSVVAAMGNPGQANYCAAKAGVIGMTKSLGLEMAAYGITVNAVAPGFVETDMTNSLTEQQREAILARVPMKKMGKTQDIADTVKFLASDSGNYITGQVLHVNGGLYSA